MRHLALLLCFALAACGGAQDAAQDPSPHCANPDASAPASAGGTERERAEIKTWIRKLMDEPHAVPDTAAKPGGMRGSPGSSAHLDAAQMDELVSAIIYGGSKFLPQSISPRERWALVTVEISLESAFVPGTSGVNPGDNTKRSVGMLQLTLPQMWDDIFRQYAVVPDLVHYDGSPWQPKDTNTEMFEHSIFDGIVSALWCISEQGRRGVPDWMGGPAGPMPRTWRSSLLAWVLGGPALKSGGDLAGQRDAYIAIQQSELQLLGFPPDLIEVSF